MKRRVFRGFAAEYALVRYIMTTYSTGELIKKLRKQKGLTQEKLSAGICSRITLSRAESGAQALSKNIFDAVMQKLGVNTADYFSCYTDARDSEIALIKKQISDFSFEGKYAEAEALLNEVKSDVRFSGGLERQFILLYSAKVKMHNGNANNYPEILNSLNEAIRITIPEYDEKKVGELLLTDQEIQIINNICVIYKYIDKIEQAIDLTYRLKESVENTKVDFDEKAKSYTVILFNLSNYLGAAGRHEEVVKICDIALDTCIKSNKYYSFHVTLLNKAYALNLLGDTEPCKRLLMQAYYVADAVRDFKNAKLIKEYAEKEHGIII